VVKAPGGSVACTAVARNSAATCAAVGLIKIRPSASSQHEQCGAPQIGHGPGSDNQKSNITR
jgi:hypothetical protein